MGTKWTQADVDRINARISGAVNNQSTNVTAPLKKHHHSTKTRDALQTLLQIVCKANNWELVAEYKFLPDRRFRFDWCIVELRVGIEYNGLQLNGAISRHTTITGHTKDCTKLNLAQLAGWKVLQYTALNYEDVAKDLLTFKK